MLRCITSLPIFITFCAIVWLCPNAAWAQNSDLEFQKTLREKIAFDQTDFAALRQGESVVKLLPPLDKREVAVSGIVSLQVPAEVSGRATPPFLKSVVSAANQRLMT